MTQRNGEVKWEQSGGSSNGESKKDLYLKLSAGSNEFRIVTSPYQYYVHSVKRDPTNKKEFGRNFACTINNGRCKLCESGNKAKARWIFGIIDRKTQSYKVLDVSYAVFSQIRKLAANTQRWGDPTKYDIDIVVDKNGGATGYYSAQPIAKEPLSAKDLEIIDNIDFDYLKKRTTPPAPEVIEKYVAKFLGLEDGQLPQAERSTDGRNSEEDTESSSTDDGDSDGGDSPEFDEY